MAQKVCDMSETMNFVIVGTGLISSIHAEAINSIENACLIGVFDKNPDSADEFAKKYNLKSYNSYEDVLDDSNVSAVCLCTPSGFHAEQAIKALEHGKHVVVEKPMAITVADCDRVIEAAKKSGCVLMPICQRRFYDNVQMLKKLYEDNAFGKISLCDLYMKFWRDSNYYSDSKWRGTKALDGGGALMNQGIHGIDLLQYIAGKAKLISSRVKAAVHDIEVEDTAVAVVEFENGAMGVIEGSTCAFPGFEKRIEIHGSNGCAILQSGKFIKLVINGEDVTPKEDSVTSKSSASDPAAIDYMLHAKQLCNFISAVTDGEKLVCDMYDGKRAVELIEQIYKFSENNS